ncbi:MAG: hypothetical protein IT581_09560 [Verrucomicrobiales bacterium]|nr:hypothetical protein [Verrucomicrobiales bacterium]
MPAFGRRCLGLGILFSVLALRIACAQPERLVAWNFESAELPSALGERPREKTRVEWVSGAIGQGVKLGTNGAVLTYSWPERRGNDVIRLSAMALRLWFRPEWSSRGVASAQGPGQWVRLVSVGDRDRNPKDGWWELSISPDGTTVEFSSSSDGSDAYVATSRPLVFEAGVWTELTLNLFPGQARLLRNFVIQMDEAPKRMPIPPSKTLRRGLSFGSRSDGTGAIRGVLDEIEFFDSELSRGEAFKRERVMSAKSLPQGDGLRIAWRVRPDAQVEVQRAPFGTTNWATLKQGSGFEELIDRTVEAGTPYHYRVLTNSRPSQLTATAGVRLPPMEQRGTALVMVDRTLADGLGPELRRLDQDLEADGWQVKRLEVPRHVDDTWEANTNAIAEIRGRVQEAWRESGAKLRAIFLIGHVAIPYAGMRAEDLHTGPRDNHFGAWPSDHYYADIDGIWTDKDSYPTYLAPTRFAVTRNEPGDGKFDTEWVGANEAGERKVEMGWGRIDFFNMPAFGRGRESEIDLLKRYLDKDHRYRQGDMPAAARTVIGPFFFNYTDLSMFDTAYRTGSRLFGFEENTLHEGDLFRIPDGKAAVWGFQSGGGAIDRIRDNMPGMVTTARLAEPKNEARVHFAMLMGSWFGDWSVGENNLLRAITASTDYGLAAMWVRFTEWHLDVMARGGTLADAQVYTANEVIRYNDPNRGTTRTLAILGDPTLRLFNLPRPKNLRGERSGDSVRLNWQASEVPGQLGYLVYRAVGDAGAEYVRMTPEPVTRASFRDTSAPAGASYQVRVAQLVETGSGSYTNLSQAAFWPAIR